MVKKKTPRHRLTVRIPEDLFKWVEKKAEQRGISTNNLILECIRRNLECKIIVREEKPASVKKIEQILANRKEKESGISPDD